MTKPSSYELLKDTHAIVSDLRKESNERMEKIEERVDILEDFRGKMLGVAIAVSAIISGGITWVWKQVTNS